MLDTFIWIIIVIAGVAIVAYLAKWIIDTFLPAPIHMPALAIVGVILLIILIIVAAKLIGGDPIGPSLLKR